MCGCQWAHFGIRQGAGEFGGKYVVLISNRYSMLQGKHMDPASKCSPVPMHWPEGLGLAACD